MPSADSLETTLEALDYSDAEGLVTADVRPSLAARQFLWHELSTKCHVDAAYFRGAVPLVAFARATDNDQADGVHRRLWNFSRVPILIASTPTRVNTYSCFVPPTAALDSSPARLESASIDADVGSVLAEFNRFNIEAGRAINSYADRFRRRDRVDAKLLAGLRDLRRSLGGDRDKERAINALIGRSIFVRYFEDRGILTRDHLQELLPFGDYLEVLAAGRYSTYELFDALAERFNGDIFVADIDERSHLTDDDIQNVAAFFRGADVGSGQESLWPMTSQSFHRN